MCEGRGLVSANAGKSGQFEVNEGDVLILPQQNSLEYSITAANKQPVVFIPSS